MTKLKLSESEKKKWEKYRASIFASTPTFLETPEQKAKRLNSYKTDYDGMFRFYFPLYADAPCAEYHLEGEEFLRDKDFAILFFIIYRGGAKSVHGNLGYPFKKIFIDNDLNFMLLIGENETKGAKLLRDIQDNLQCNQRIIADFGEQMSYGDWSDGEFTIKKGTSFMSLGINQSARGLRTGAARPDYIVVDDVEDRKKARNAEIVAERIDKIVSDVAEAANAFKSRLVINNNLITRTGIIAGLLKEFQNKPDVKVIWRNAVDEKGNPTWPERFTVDYWVKKRERIKAATWQREFMNNPIEEGLLFKNEWMHYKPMQIIDYKRLIVYGDLSYRATGDYKALVLMGKKDGEFHIIDAFVERTSLQNVISYCYDLRKSIPQQIIIDFVIEANFIQDMFLDAFLEEGRKRGHHLNIRGDKCKKPDKYDRIEALTTIFQNKLIYFNRNKEQDSSFQTMVDQFLMFEKNSGVNDDAPDAVEGAVHILNVEHKRSILPTSWIPRSRKNDF